MRSLDIISQHFIPNIFDVLGLFAGGKRVFKLDVWAVDEFYLDSEHFQVSFQRNVHNSGQLSTLEVHSAFSF
jgi:hypothetical protein